METPPGIIIQTLLIAFQIALTAIIGVIVNRMNDRNKKQMEDAEKEERLRKEREKAQADGTKALLRDRILQADVHFSAEGFASAAEKDNIQLMYHAYHGLGGNDIATASYKHIMALPLPLDEHAS